MRLAVQYRAKPLRSCLFRREEELVQARNEHDRNDCLNAVVLLVGDQWMEGAHAHLCGDCVFGRLQLAVSYHGAKNVWYASDRCYSNRGAAVDQHGKSVAAAPLLIVLRARTSGDAGRTCHGGEARFRDTLLRK